MRFAVIKVPEAARIEPLEIKLIIGQLNASVNGESRTLDAEPFLSQKSTGQWCLCVLLVRL